MSAWRLLSSSHHPYNDARQVIMLVTDEGTSSLLMLAEFVVIIVFMFYPNRSLKLLSCIILYCVQSVGNEFGCLLSESSSTVGMASSCL